MTGNEKLKLFRERIKNEIIPKYPQYKTILSNGNKEPLEYSLEAMITDKGFVYNLKHDEDIGDELLKDVQSIYEEIVLGD